MSALHVACAAEGGYVPHSAAMLHSVLCHNTDVGVHIHYLCAPEFPVEAAQSLALMVERQGGRISFLTVTDEDIADLPTRGFTRKATWYRVFLPERLPQLERILYLDSDIIVRDSLSPLWKTDLADAYVAAVTNVFEPYYAHRPAALGLPPSQRYFNAGVLLFNLALMRRDGCMRTLREYAAAHAGELLWRDQDAMNVVLGARRRPLHPRWNCMNSVMHFSWSPQVLGARAVAEAKANPAIRHFEGPGINKPWHYLSDRRDRRLYLRHRRQTPWPRCELEGATMPNRVYRVVRGVRRRLGLPTPPPPTPSVLDRDPGGVVNPA